MRAVMREHTIKEELTSKRLNSKYGPFVTRIVEKFENLVVSITYHSPKGEPLRECCTYFKFLNKKECGHCEDEGLMMKYITANLPKLLKDIKAQGIKVRKRRDHLGMISINPNNCPPDLNIVQLENKMQPVALRYNLALTNRRIRDTSKGFDYSERWEWRIKVNSPVPFDECI